MEANKRCEWCGRPLTGSKYWQKYCVGKSCRQLAYLNRKKQAAEWNSKGKTKKEKVGA